MKHDVVVEVWFKDGGYHCETCSFNDYLGLLDNLYSKKVRSFRVYFYL